MALGTFGSTLNDELNRLANGGTYRTMDQMVDEALAAKQWANRENINPYSTDTVGILNEIAGLGLDKRNWLDFNGVCNYIAGTTGLPAAAALRQVYPTTDLLTGVASYYVDGYAGSNYIPTTASGYMYLPGVAGNNATTPDAAVLDITGDIDIRVKVALDNWIPSAVNTLVGKYTPSNRSYALSVNSNGTLSFQVTTDGSTLITSTSTVATGIANGATKWVRGTRVAATGTVQFFLSDDGTTWTQLGADVSNTSGNMFSGNAVVEVGTKNAGLAEFARGKFYRAQVLNGIDGTVVFDANFETAMTSQTVASFTEGSSNAATVTVNRTTYNFQLDTINNLGAAGSLLPTTLGSSTAADSNDPKFLDWTGTNYVYTPGVINNYLSIPDSNALDITGDIDLRYYGALDDWTPSSRRTLISKLESTETSYRLNLESSGVLSLWFYDSGGNLQFANSTVAPTIADGASLWVRATLDVDNGASGKDFKFFTSTDGTTWTQLGTTVTQAGTTNIKATTAEVKINQLQTGSSDTTAGKIFRAQIFDGIDGTKVLDVDTSVITAGSATSFTALTGQTVTITRSTSGRKTVAVTQPTWLFGTDDYMEVNNRYMSSGTYLYLPGLASNNCTSPDSAALDITGDLDIRVKIALDDWTPSVSNALVAKYGTTGQRSYLLQIDQPSGTPSLTWSTNGTTLIAQSASVAPTVLDGSTLWIRVTLDVDNGAGGYDVKFYTSSDGTTWTQLGITKTGASTTSIFAGTSQLEIGNWSAANGPCRGKYYRAQIRNGIDGTIVFDANFETSITSLLQTSFTESSANAATVTINRSGSAYRSAGITTAGYLYPGATNTFTASATDFLNFGAADSFTVLAAVRDWNWNSTPYVSKTASYATAGDRGYIIYSVTTPGNVFFIKDGSVAVFDGTTPAGTFGSMTSFFGVRNVSTDLLSAYINTTITSPATDTTTASLSTVDTLRLGRVGSAYADTELYAAAVFRQTLTASQIRQIVNYFANREVYL